MVVNAAANEKALKIYRKCMLTHEKKMYSKWIRTMTRRIRTNSLGNNLKNTQFYIMSWFNPQRLVAGKKILDVISCLKKNKIIILKVLS